MNNIVKVRFVCQCMEFLNTKNKTCKKQKQTNQKWAFEIGLIIGIFQVDKTEIFHSNLFHLGLQFGFPSAP